MDAKVDIARVRFPSDSLRRAKPNRYERLVTHLLGKSISRRDLFRLTAGATGALPLVGSVARAASNFETQATRDAVTFSIERFPVWSIDTRVFDGNPKLFVETTDASRRIVLSGARYPGTSLSADLTLQLWREGWRWQGRLCMPSMGLDAVVPFDGWLIGSEEAVARGNVGPELAKLLGAASKGKPITARFRPGWAFDIECIGKPFFGVPSHEGTFHLARLGLALDDTPSLFDVTPPRRTLVWLTPDPSCRHSASAGDFSVRSDEAPGDLLVEHAPSRRAIYSEWSGAGTAVSMRGGGVNPIDINANRIQLIAIETKSVADAHVVFESKPGSTWARVGETTAKVSCAAGTVYVDCLQTARDAAIARTPLGVEVFVVHFPRVDRAIFVRRSGGEATHPRRLWHGVVDLDAFDLRLMDAATAMDVTFRFRGIDLAFNGLQWQLRARSGSTPLVECDLGSQHVHEGASLSEKVRSGCSPDIALPTLTMVALELRAAHDLDNLAVDASVLTVTGPVPPLSVFTVEEAADAISRLKQADPLAYQNLLREVGNRIAAPARIPEKDLRTGIARARAANNSWLTFDFEPGADGSLSMPLSLAGLFGWLRRPRSRLGHATLKLRRSEYAGIRNVRDPAKLEQGREFEDLDFNERLAMRDKEGDREPLSLARDHVPAHRAVTAIEAPYRVAVSPLAVQWSGTSFVRGLDGTQRELWHIRAKDLQLRAIWSPDFATDIWSRQPPFPVGPENKWRYRASLDGRDRHEFVALTSAFGHDALLGSEHVVPLTPARRTARMAPPSCKPAPCVKLDDIGEFIPKAFEAPILLLSSRGATFKYRGRWDPPASAGGCGALTVSKWFHDSQLGRDTDVIVEYKGALFPIGHPAVLVKQTTRKFVVEKGRVVARLEQRFYIRIPAFTRAFPALEQPYGSRDLPHTAVEMKEWETPDLCPPETRDSSIAGLGAQAFWPLTPGQPVPELVEFEYVDPRQGARVRAPLVFVDNDVIHSPAKLARVICEYREMAVSPLSEAEIKDWPTTAARGLARVVSGKLNLVPGSPSKDSEFEVDSYLLDCNIPRREAKQVSGKRDQAAEGNAAISPSDNCSALPPTSGKPTPGTALWLCVTSSMERERQPPFYPRMHRARLRSNQIAAMTGGKPDWYLLGFDPLYVDEGFDSKLNPGRVFGRFAIAGPGLKFSSDTTRSGGSFSPDTITVWWSLDRGPVGGEREDFTKRAALRLKDEPQVRIERVAGQPREDEWAHRGEFHPQKYFGQVLGDAKIAGCVRIADVLDAAIGLAGDRVPSLNQQTLFAYAIEEMRPLLVKILGALSVFEGKLLELSRELPSSGVARIQVALRALKTSTETLSQEVSRSAPRIPQMIAAMTAVGKAAGDVRDEVVALQSNPKQLLPADLLQATPYKEVDQAITLYRIVSGGRGAIDEAFRSPPAPLAESLGKLRDAIVAIEGQLTETVLAELDRSIAGIVERLASSPAFKAALTIALQVQSEIAALRVAVRSRSAAILVELPHRLEPLIAAYRRLLGWAEWLDATAAGTCAQVLGKVGAFLEDLEKRVLFDLSKPGSSLTTLRAATRNVRMTLDDLAASIPSAAEQFAGQIPAKLTELRRSIASFALTLGAIEQRLQSKEFPALPDVSTVCQSHAADAARAWAAVSDDRFTLLFGSVQQFLSGLDDLLRRTSELDGLLSATILNTADLWPQNATKPPFPAKADEVLKAVKALVEGCYLWQFIPEHLPGIASALEALPPNPLFEDISKRLREVSSLFKQLPTTQSELASATRKFEEVRAFLVAPLNVEAGVGSAISSGVRAIQQRLDAPATAVAGQIAAIAQALAAGLAEAISKEEWKKFAGEALKERLAQAVTRLRDVSAPTGGLAELEEMLRDVRGALDAFDAVLREISGAIDAGRIDRLVDLRAVADELLAAVGVPTSVRISYTWDTQIKSFPDGASAIFVPLEAKTLSISSVIETNLRNPAAPSVSIKGRLDPFEIRLFGALPFLSLRFQPLTFSQDASGSKMTLNIDKVDFGGSLAWVKTLQEWLSPKNGLYAEPGARGIEVGYRFSEDSVGVAGMTLQNVGFQVSATLPYDNRPALFAAQVSSLQKPFLISIGIWGGGGFVKAVSRIDALEYLEGSFEYGVVSAFKFGPAEGAGRITAGVYVRLGGRDASVTGFFNASGAATIANVITISACFRVSISYKLETGAVSGVATYTIKAKIGFVEYGYSVEVAYERQGDTRGTQNQASSIPWARRTMLAARDTGTASDAVTEGAGSEVCVDLDENHWNEYWRVFDSRASCIGGRP